jgi:hypothetical protein
MRAAYLAVAALLPLLACSTDRPTEPDSENAPVLEDGASGSKRASPNLRVQPTDEPWLVGESHQLYLKAQGQAAGFNPVRAVTWETSNGEIVSVDRKGRATALKLGSATITATTPVGRLIEATITVADDSPHAAIELVQLQPTAVSMTLGQYGRLVATAKDARGVTIVGRDESWKTSDSQVATVSAKGVVGAQAAGSATITVTVDGVSGSSLVTVGNPSVEHPPVSPPTPEHPTEEPPPEEGSPTEPDQPEEPAQPPTEQPPPEEPPTEQPPTEQQPPPPPDEPDEPEQSPPDEPDEPEEPTQNEPDEPTEPNEHDGSGDPDQPSEPDEPEEPEEPPPSEPPPPPPEPPAPPPPAGPPVSGSWTHLPGGMSTLVDEPFNSRNPSGWIVQDGGGGYVTHVSDEGSEPVSPGGAVRFTWPAGSSHENPGVVERAFGGGSRHIYIGATFKVASPSVWGFDGFEKIIIVNQQEGCRSRAFLQLNGALNTNAYTGSIGFVGNYGLPDGTAEPTLAANRSAATVGHDQWFKVEMELIASSSSGAPDGVYRLWINDTMVWEYTNLRLSACAWETLDIWPQMGDQVSRAVPQHIDVGHVYIARQ